MLHTEGYTPIVSTVAGRAIIIENAIGDDSVREHCGQLLYAKAQPAQHHLGGRLGVVLREDPRPDGINNEFGHTKVTGRCQTTSVIAHSRDLSVHANESCRYIVYELHALTQIQTAAVTIAGNNWTYMP